MSAKDIPIIFSAAMVRALLEGRKTQTRRVAVTSRTLSEESSPGRYRSRTKLLDSPWKRTVPGDRLWVRENFAYVGTCDPGFLTFAATYPDDLAKYGCENVPPTLKEAGYKWRPSIHMPREASRMTLLVTAVKVERLNDITEVDAIAEGVRPIIDHGAGSAPYLHRIAFEQLWMRLHGGDAWLANPLVVAITFRVIRANIDAPEARAA